MPVSSRYFAAAASDSISSAENQVGRPALSPSVRSRVATAFGGVEIQIIA